MNLVDMIKKHEGYRSKVYQDTTGHATIGYGFNLDAIELPRPVAELWLAFEIDRHEDMLEPFEWYKDLDPVRQDVIINMHYNLGHSGFMDFKKMIAALKLGDYEEAAKEMLDSKWANQVGRRATDLAALMEGNDNVGI